MNLDQAEAIIEAFGPCTDLYECYTAKDILADYGDEDADDFVDTQLRVFDVQQDRANGAAAEQSETYGEEHHTRAISEGKEQLAGIKTRLRTAGFLRDAG